MSPVERVPGYFGPPERSLFGWLHRPRGGGTRDVAVVLCPPLGYEAHGAHRTVRELADAAASAGFVTLRFDYDATGDSAGDLLAVGQWESWQQSVREAVAAARSAAGTERVALIGFRLGGTIAALAANGLNGPVDLALVAPIDDGRRWARELRALRGAMGRAEGGGNDTAVDGIGIVFPAEAHERIAQTQLAKAVPNGVGRWLLLQRDDRPVSDDFANAIRDAGQTVEQRVVPGIVEMLQDPHEAVVPHNVVQSLLEWLTAAAPERTSQSAPETSVLDSGPRVVGRGIQERAMWLDADQRLFGILSTPAAETSNGKALVLLNAGGNHHIGNGALYVQLARTLAGDGWSVLRYDVSGIGDSDAHEGRPPGEVYTPFAVEDFATAVAALTRELQPRRIEAAGLCSGAYHAYRGAAADVPVDAITVVNPLTFDWREGMSLAYPAFQVAQAGEQYKASALSAEKWRKLLRGDVNVAAAGAIVMRSVLASANTRVRTLRRSLGVPEQGDIAVRLKRIDERGIRVRFVFSRGDPGELLLREGSGGTLGQLERKGALTIAHLEDCDHALSRAWMRDEFTRWFREALHE